MQKNRFLFYLLLIVSCILPVSAEDLTLKDLTLPKPPAYRVGLSANPENQFIQAIEDATKPEKQISQIDNSENSIDLTYADLSIKRLSKEISQELQYEEKNMVSDLSLLWQGAATQSDTINFALYKLANPDADKPDEKSIKKVLTTIASMSTLVGAGVGNPVIAGSSLIGGNILGIMGQDTKALNYKYTKVTDADMIILIRKVEDLQQKAVDLYYDYMSAKRQLEFMNDLVADRKRKFELAQKNDARRELIVITDAYYRTAMEKQRAAKSEFFSKRAALEQFVGNETFIQFEKELAAREGSNLTENNIKETPMPEIDVEDYNNTVKNVEKYTKEVSKEQNINEENKNEESANTTQFDDGDNFYSSFPSGFAAPVTLEEFFHPELMEKPKKQKPAKVEKPKKQASPKTKKAKKEKPQKLKKEKIKVKQTKKQKEKQVKEKPIKDVVKEPTIQETTTSWYETWKNEAKAEKLLEKQAKKEAKEQKLKNKKAKKAKSSEKTKTSQKEKLKKSNVSDENTLNEETQGNSSNEELIENFQELSIDEHQQDKTNKKEKKVKEKKPKKPKKDKNPKKEKDLYPELHGQKPIHKYPRNSEKDLIFLHGRDKHEAKKPSEMTDEEKKELKIRNEAYSREYRATRRARESAELLEEASLKAPSQSGKSQNKPRPVRMAPSWQQGQPYLQYDQNYEETAPAQDFIKEVQPKRVSQTRVKKNESAEIQNIKANKTTPPATDNNMVKIENPNPPAANSFGLPPLDEIKVPELKKGGYSIHSSY